MAKEQISENLKKAIDKIVKTEKEVSILLQGQEMLLVNVKNVFKTLLGNMRHLDTITDIASGETIKMEPLTRVLGQNVGPKEKVKMPEVSKDERAAFVEMVDKVYEGFDKRENRDLMESLTPTIILAVAKKAGLTVEEGKTINTQYITYIKQKIALNRELEAIKGSALPADPAAEATGGESEADVSAAIEDSVAILRAGGNIVIKDFAAAHGVDEKAVADIVKKAQVIFAAKPQADAFDFETAIEWIKTRAELGDTITVQTLIDEFKIEEAVAIDLLNAANAKIEG